MAARNWITRDAVETALFEAATACGLTADDGAAQTRRTLDSGLDGGITVPHSNLDEQNSDSEREDWEDAAQPAPKLFIKSSSEFVAGFVPPEYVVVGLLQRQFFYSLTGQTGAGKTDHAAVICQTALGRPFADRETKRTRVLSGGRK